MIMFRFIILLLLWLPALSFAQHLPEKDPKNENVFLRAEVMPSFPGGEQAMYKFISSNLKYPLAAAQNGIEGKVYLSFIVDAKGKIKEITALRENDPDLRKEAIRVIRSMPDWTPGMQDGAPVDVRMSLPVYFKLSE